MQVVSHPPKAPLPKVPQPKAPLSRAGLPHSSPRLGTLILALAAGLAAALLAFLVVRGHPQPTSPALVSVVVAARDIPARTRLTSAWLKVRQASPAVLPAGTVTTPAELTGKVTTEPIAVGAAVTGSAVTVPSAALGMAFALPPSRRAMTVALDPTDSADQFIRPGDHVDILATDEPGSGPADVRTVLQDVRLLAVGAQTSPDAAPPSSPGSGSAHVTVAVSPAQAQALVLAAARGKIHLSLRAVGDDAIASLPVFPASTPGREVFTPLPRPHAPRKMLPQAPKMPEDPVPLPPLPVPLSTPSPAHVTMTVIKGSQSQTVSVEP